MIKYTEKPPQGLKPKYVHDSDRLQEVSEAIKRYVDARRIVPIDWLEEYNELITNINKKS